MTTSAEAGIDQPTTTGDDARDPRWGLLLVNLGTPRSVAVGDVRRYLREFLMDPRVVDIPAIPRWLLVNAIIAPFRAPKSARAYATIWTDRGSPLLRHGEDLVAAVRERLGDRVAGVELAMRYQQPSVAAALERLISAGAAGILVLPLFPQYSQAAWLSAVEKVHLEAARLPGMPTLRVVPPFFDDPGYLDACAAQARPVIDELRPEKVLISFHGVPERHVRRSDLSTPGTSHCLATTDCCDRLVPANRLCYRAQCFATARGIATRLGLGPDRYEVAFQSRLGPVPWIRPFFDQRVVELAESGVQRLAVLSPSFVADCLETLEEIGERARDDFREHGGEELRLVPSLNASPAWIDAVEALALSNLPAASEA
jgi:ferrochelatase